MTAVIGRGWWPFGRPFFLFFFASPPKHEAERATAPAPADLEPPQPRVGVTQGNWGRVGSGPTCVYLRDRKWKRPEDVARCCLQDDVREGTRPLTLGGRYYGSFVRVFQKRDGSPW